VSYVEGEINVFKRIQTTIN